MEISLDGTDLATYGLVLHDQGLVLGQVLPQYGELVLPGAPGSLVVGPAVVAPRDIEMRASIIAASHANLLTAIDAVTALAKRPGVKLRTGDRSGRFLEVTHRGPIEVTPWPAAGSIDATVAQVRFRWRAGNPYWQDDTVTSVTTTADTWLTLAVGTGPIWPVYESATGDGSSPFSLEAENADGTFFRLTADPAVSGDKYRLDSAPFAMTFAVGSGGVWVPADERINSDQALLYPVPLYAAADGTGPRIATAAGALVVTATYRKQYL